MNNYSLDKYLSKETHQAIHQRKRKKTVQLSKICVLDWLANSPDLDRWKTFVKYKLCLYMKFQGSFLHSSRWRNASPTVDYLINFDQSKMAELRSLRSKVTWLINSWAHSLKFNQIESKVSNGFQSYSLVGMMHFIRATNHGFMIIACVLMIWIRINLFPTLFSDKSQGNMRKWILYCGGSYGICKDCTAFSFIPKFILRISGFYADKCKIVEYFKILFYLFKFVPCLPIYKCCTQCAWI